MSTSKSRCVGVCGSLWVKTLSLLHLLDFCFEAYVRDGQTVLFFQNPFDLRLLNCFWCDRLLGLLCNFIEELVDVLLDENFVGMLELFLLLYWGCCVF